MTSEPRAFIVRGDDGQEYGPVDLEELREWAVENRVGLGTEVRRDGGAGEWEPWQHFPELVALLAQVHASGRPLPPLPSLPQAMPVLAPLGRRAVACAADLFLSSLLVILVVAALYVFLPKDVVLQQAQFYLRVYEAARQDIDPSVVPPPLPDWYVFCGKLASFVLPVLYFAGFHAAHGRTPGKSVLRLQVVDAQGRKPAFRVALLRGFILMVSVNLFGIPLFYAFFNPQRRALHDIAAGTYVVER